MYAIPLSSGAVRISEVKPVEPCIFFEVDSIPEGAGMLKIGPNGALFRDAVPKDPDDTIALSEKMEALIKENELLKAQLQAQTDRSDFLEDCMAELAIQAYQ